ncbi:hypothetical protein [Prescottella subtropica]|uniref:hypothetical protein n=1 Tax=Prescottella subtropica TaxID=2545757 RepID=UPI0010F6446C|nr:hypothetical protein [Prescottella subtropica]
MRKYNGTPADIAIVPAGSTLWRVLSSTTKHPPNNFNAKNIQKLEDARALDPMTAPMPRQGRFDLVHDDTVCPGGSALGGQLYVGLSVAAVVAEGILRGTDVPAVPVLPQIAVDGLALAEMVTDQDIPVAVLDEQKSLTRMNQRLELFGCDPLDYYDTRVTGTNILACTPRAHGLRYRCRNGFEERALLLADRGQDMRIRVERLEKITTSGWAHDMITTALWDSFGLTLG